MNIMQKRVYFEQFDCMKRAVKLNRLAIPCKCSGGFNIFHRTGHETQVSCLLAPWLIQIKQTTSIVVKIGAF